MSSWPGCQLQFASQPAMWQDLNLSGFALVRYVVAGRVRLTFCVICSQPASLPAAIGQPTSHVTRYQSLRLSGWIFGGRRTRSPTTLGPCQGSQHSHLFPLGTDLPDHGQASDTNELCSLLYTFGTMFSDHLQFCIYAAQSHILACNVEKCYMDYVLSRLIYTHPSTINLMYYYTKVLLLRNYFYHQRSEMLSEKVSKRYIWAHVNQT